MFAILAVFSAVALFLAIPRLAASDTSFTIAVAILFAVEVALFEFAIRQHLKRQRAHDAAMVIQEELRKLSHTQTRRPLPSQLPYCLLLRLRCLSSLFVNT